MIFNLMSAGNLLSFPVARSPVAAPRTMGTARHLRGLLPAHISPAAPNHKACCPFSPLHPAETSPRDLPAQGVLRGVVGAGRGTDAPRKVCSTSTRASPCNWPASTARTNQSAKAIGVFAGASSRL